MAINELRENHSYLEERQKHILEAQQLQEKAEKEKKEAFYDKKDSIKKKFEEKGKKFGQFKADVKKKLVREALENIVKGSITNPTERESALCEAIVNQYIDDTGTFDVLRKMKLSNNELMQSVYENVNAYYTKMTEDADMDKPETQTMDPSDINDFWKNVTDSTDVDDVTNMIRLRVANAEEEFINRNLRDKENIETIMKDTADRVQAAKASNDNDYSEEVEESVTKEARDKIYRVQHEGRRNVFGRMVLNLGELAMTKEPLKKEFVLENGRLNLDKVVETVRCIYTVLETVSSLNLEKIDEEYIKETLESMNA